MSYRGWLSACRPGRGAGTRHATFPQGDRARRWPQRRLTRPAGRGVHRTGVRNAANRRHIPTPVRVTSGYRRPNADQGRPAWTGPGAMAAVRRRQCPMSRASPANRRGAEDRSREDHQVPHRMLPITLGPMRAANGAGLDVRARPASEVVGGEWGHVSRMRDFGCSGLGDDLKTTWTLGAASPRDRQVMNRARQRHRSSRPSRSQSGSQRAHMGS